MIVCFLVCLWNLPLPSHKNCVHLIHTSNSSVSWSCSNTLSPQTQTSVYLPLCIGTHVERPSYMSRIYQEKLDCPELDTTWCFVLPESNRNSGSSSTLLPCYKSCCICGQFAIWAILFNSYSTRSWNNLFTLYIVHLASE
jgi:hypothetical protein